MGRLEGWFGNRMDGVSACQCVLLRCNYWGEKVFTHGMMIHNYLYFKFLLCFLPKSAIFF